MYAFFQHTNFSILKLLVSSINLKMNLFFGSITLVENYDILYNSLLPYDKLTYNKLTKKKTAM